METVEELMTFEGTTSGLAAGGTLSLNSDLLNSTTQTIQVPPGMQLKLWAKRVSSLVSVTFRYMYANAASPTSWTEISRDTFPGPSGGASEFSVEKRRPIVVRGITGNEQIQITYLGANTGGTVSSAEFEAIFGDDLQDVPVY